MNISSKNKYFNTIIYNTMNYFIITGSSRGIGKSLCSKLLENNNNIVFGISRSNTLQHKNFNFCLVDLSNSKAVLNFEFPDIESNADRIVLVNNAGKLGDVHPVGKIDNNEIQSTFQLNTIAPAVLINKFINKYNKESAQKVIINISSGAARHTVPSWSSYCASKAALDMFSMVTNTEQNESESGKSVHIFSVAPGIVDTEMQNKIRGVSKERFPFVEKFREYKSKQMLVSPDKVAGKLMDMIYNPQNYQDVICDLRDM